MSDIHSNILSKIKPISAGELLLVDPKKYPEYSGYLTGFIDTEVTGRVEMFLKPNPNQKEGSLPSYLVSRAETGKQFGMAFTKEKNGNKRLDFLISNKQGAEFNAVAFAIEDGKKFEFNYKVTPKRSK